MIIYSNSFDNGGMMPKKYTCDGEDISPHIGWKEIPDGTKSLIVLGYDMDAPTKGFSLFKIIHWLVYNIPTNMNELPEGVPHEAIQSNGMFQGVSFFGNRYGGPCPPFGEHRYVFKVFAVDKTLDLEPTKTKWKTISNKIENHILDEAEIIGVYRRHKE